MRLMRRLLAALVLLACSVPALAGTPTTNYGWIKPTVGADANNWGTYWDNALDGIDTTVFGMCPKAGCTYTGIVTLMTGDTTHAPLKFVAGTNLTAAAAGAVEWDGTSLYLTQTTGPTRKTVAFIDSALSGNTTGSAAKLTTARAITMTGDVSWTVNFDGSAAASAAGTIQAGVVTGSKIASNTVANSNLATAANNTIKANVSGGVAAPSDVAISTLQGSSSTTFAAGNDSRFSTAPQNSQSAPYTLALTDAGGQVYHPSADVTARTWTIPANASVAFVVGTKIDLVNDCSAGALTIAITTDTLVWFSGGSTGSRTLAACGEATLSKVTATRWVIVGVGLS